MTTRIGIARVLIATALAGFLTADPALADPAPDRLHAQNYVVVSPEGPKDGGDFGPLTPGTKTSGIQEAFNHAKAKRKDVYIAGGTMPEKFQGGVVYHIQETIHIPWFQDFHLDGGEYVINYDSQKGDAVVIDSQMSCRFKFGLIVCPSDGTAVHIRPETKGPDGFAVITTSTFEFNAIVGGGSVFPDGKRAPTGAGLFLDAAVGPILNNKFYATEIIACETGLVLTCGPDGNEKTIIADNSFDVPMLHLCQNHLQVGNAKSKVCRNRFQVNITSENLKDTTGARIFGQQNVFTLDVLNAGKDKGVVFEAQASDNRVVALNLASGYTNNATHPTNRIVPLQSVGYGIETPALPDTGATLVNRTPYTIEAVVTTPGVVSTWTVVDAKGLEQTITAPLLTGQTWRLEPGDGIRFIYTTAPVWRWRAL